MSDTQLFMVGVLTASLVVAAILSVVFQVNKYADREEEEMAIPEH